MNKLNPAIVVAAYNRDVPLKRLLNSLSKAYYDSPVDLVISIDKNGNQDVYSLADSFNWPHGNKEVVKKKHHLGLRHHILECGDLTARYGSIVLLEDDLFVSPYFYTYARQCLEFYGSESNIAGISLYSHGYNETAYMGFLPLEDSSDVFFLQIASSWGQSWTKEQWQRFVKWYEKNKDRTLTELDKIPGNVLQWPGSSWKKYFIAYMIASDKYFVYPRISLSTNFSDPGIHHKTKQTRLQVPLQFFPKEWTFKSFKDSLAVYDAYHEILPEKLKQLHGDLQEYDLEIDFYGQKNLAVSNRKYALTSKPAIDPVKTFGKELKPIELNLVYGIEGSHISLAKTENCRDYTEECLIYDLSYYYNIPTQFISDEEQIRSKEEMINQYYYRYFSDTLKEKDMRIHAAERRIQDICTSRSWKITEPLRKISMFIKKLKHRGRIITSSADVECSGKDNGSSLEEETEVSLKESDFTPEKKAFILKKHLMEKIPVPIICEQYGLEHAVFYEWLKEFFESGDLVFKSIDPIS
jgi:hypothetical protein